MKTSFSKALACTLAFCGALWLMAPGVPAEEPPTLTVQWLDGYAQLSITGPVGAACQIQYLTNLAQTDAWLPLADLTLASNPQPWVDLDSPVTGQRFFRVMTVVSNPPRTNMVLIPAGSFTMGGQPDGDIPMGYPTHTVYVSAFYMDQYLVTKALWDEVKNWNDGNGYSYDHEGSGKADTHPVQTLNWWDCVKWCNARSEMAGLTPCYYNEAGLRTVYKAGTNTPYVNWSANGYRLPTEAEWEKAARGGTSGHRFSWSDTDTISQDRANYKADWNLDENGNEITWDLSYPGGFDPLFMEGWFPYTNPVDYFTPNGYGLYDMTGNVWQWCWDLLGSYPYTPQSDPHGPSWSPDRVNRGGSWDEQVIYCRVAYRGSNKPFDAVWSVGLRTVRLPDQ